MPVWRDIEASRAPVAYDDTASLVHLVGSGLAASPKGFGELRGSLTTYLAELPGDTGIRVLSEKCAISAAPPPTDSTLLVGGPDASAVTSHFTKLGWKAKDGELVTVPNPGLSGSGGDAASACCPGAVRRSKYRPTLTTDPPATRQ